MSDNCGFIDQVASPALSLLSSLPVDHENTINGQPEYARSDTILVHCDLGRSRSPSIVIAYLMRKLRIQQVDVFNFVQSKQRIKPSENFIRQLQVWEEVEYETWKDEDKFIPNAPYKAFLEDRAALLKKKGLTGNEPLAPLSL